MQEERGVAENRTLESEIQKLINAFWDEEELPDQWQ
jgi:hypothetical protein